MNLSEVNVLVLAYVGDAVYELSVRKHLVSLNKYNVKQLQEESLKFVSAKSQCYLLMKLVNDGFFTGEEERIIKRGRNCRVIRHPKNCDVATYRNATGFECLIGFLSLDGKNDRIEKIMEEIFKYVS